MDKFEWNKDDGEMNKYYHYQMPKVHIEQLLDYSEHNEVDTYLAIIEQLVAEHHVENFE